MSGVLMAGFSYWGVFVVLGLIFVGYAVWMRHVERGEADRASAAEAALREGAP